MTKTQNKATKRNSVEKREESCLEKINRRKKVKISNKIKDKSKREEFKKKTSNKKNQDKSKTSLRIN
jgi:hypothetical protein